MNPNDPQMQQQMGPPSKPDIPWFVSTNMTAPITIPNFMNMYEVDQLIEFFEDNTELHDKGRTGTHMHMMSEENQNPKEANNIEMRDVDIINITQHMMGNQLLVETYNKIIGMVHQVNSTSFRFDIDSCMQMELARYQSGGKYFWHTDTGGVEGARCRKLSFSLSLSEPESYIGGELGFMMGKDPESTKPPCGSVTIFPSFTVHQVNPVTEGTRYALFGWFDGPRFK